MCVRVCVNVKQKICSHTSSGPGRARPTHAHTHQLHSLTQHRSRAHTERRYVNVCVCVCVLPGNESSGHDDGVDVKYA